ncbi:hypothetical protein [Oceanobacillus timonensis]|uniref:hypothetical protein n=1 Tax=Oceanobacillus timonensis TaxID=1926285 RepID=UPI0009BA0418|nr:hypothetical protein [Oceanobacillus timonensis]
MSNDLKPEIKKTLMEMDFVRKYEELSKKYSIENIQEEERLSDIDMVLVMEIIEKIAHQLGCSVSYDKKENFFRVEDTVQKELVFAVHIAIISDRVEFTWEVVHNDEVRLGRPWFSYARLLIDLNYKIRMPAFKNYDELEAILKESFDMYEEFKAILIKEYLG